MKETITVPELVSGLLQFLKVTELEKNSLTLDANNPKVFNEILFLKVFAIDFGIHSVLKNTGQVEAVRDTYYAKLLEITQDPSCFGKIAARLDAYSKANRLAHDGVQLLENVGLSFSEFCGEAEMSMVIWGSGIFASLSKSTEQIINSFKIIVS